MSDVNVRWQNAVLHRHQGDRERRNGASINRIVGVFFIGFGFDLALRHGWP